MPARRVVVVLCFLAATLSVTAAPTTQPADAFAAARALATDGKHTEAIAKYSEALNANPKNGSIRAYRALSHLALKHTAEAQADVDAAMKLNEKDPVTLEAAGQIKISQNRVAEGRGLFEKAAKLSPRTAGEIYTDLAAALSSKDDPKLAADVEAALKAATVAEPPSAEAVFQLGQSYANSGDGAGRAYLQKYLELSAKLPGDQRDAQKVQLAKQLIRALDVVKSLGR